MSILPSSRGGCLTAKRSVALLTLRKQIKRSDIVDALEKIVPQTVKFDEHAVRVDPVGGRSCNKIG